MKQNFFIFVLVLAFANAEAAPLDAQQVQVLLESGFSTAEVASQVEKQGYAGTNDKATLQRLRTAGADAGLILLLAKAGQGHAQPPDNIPPPPPTDFYQTGKDRVDLLMKNGKYGLSLKGETVVEPKWDYWRKDFPGDKGGGTVTFSQISSAGYLLIGKIRKGSESLVELAMLEKPAYVEDEAEIAGYVNMYLMDHALGYDDDKKRIKIFDESIQFKVPPTDDPRALFPFKVKAKGDVREQMGLKLASGETIFPPTPCNFNELTGLPVENPVSTDKSVLGSSAYGLKMPQMKALAGSAADNLQAVFIERQTDGIPNVGGTKTDPRLWLVLFEQSTADKFLKPRDLAFLKEWWAKGSPRDLVYVRYVRAFDDTYKALVFIQKNTWTPEEILKWFTEISPDK
jgi:hypothetical protein